MGPQAQNTTTTIGSYSQIPSHSFIPRILGRAPGTHEEVEDIIVDVADGVIVITKIEKGYGP